MSNKLVFVEMDSHVLAMGTLGVGWLFSPLSPCAESPIQVQDQCRLRFGDSLCSDTWVSLLSSGWASNTQSVIVLKSPWIAPALGRLLRCLDWLNPIRSENPLLRTMDVWWGGIQVSLGNEKPSWQQWMKAFSFQRVQLNAQDMQYG